MRQTTIPITFDKSHLTTIGTRLYAQSLDLVRELAANAYDADATTVKISLSGDQLTVADNGTGMDREGLKQYFQIGSEYKRESPLSERFKRRRIGEFGIGKFAVLAICDRFTIFTQKNGYSATVVFDKDQFEESQEWSVPVLEHETKGEKSGTKISLFELRYPIDGEQLERRLRQQLPLNQKDFTVFINGERLARQTVPGRRWRLRAATQFGLISGEVVLSSLLLPREQMGVAIKVRGVAIKRAFFGLDRRRALPKRRLTGEINADFLPLTSSRDNFLRESGEYRVFMAAVVKKMKQIAREMNKLAAGREDVKTDKVLTDALDQVRRALKKNPDIFLTHDLPLFSTDQAKNDQLEKSLTEGLGSGVAARTLPKAKRPESQSGAGGGAAAERAIKGVSWGKRRLVRTILKDKRRTVKRIKIGGMSIVCSLSNLGEGEPESFVEGGVIFINRDHPLFKQTRKTAELNQYHLTRLITQELVKLGRPEQIDQAYEWQSRLLTSAMAGGKQEQAAKKQ